MSHTRRPGLTLIEVMIAILLFAVGALGLAASSAAIVRQLVAAAQRSRAAQVAATREEKTHAAACGSISGSEIVAGIVDTWRVTAQGTRIILDQTVQRRDSRGIHEDTFRSAAPCD